jgi:F0F1-type ATP synthase delta subunit
MLTLLILFLVQCAFAVVVILVLKRLLDKELMNAALEKFESCKSSSEVIEITVLSASRMNEEFKSRLESVRKRKFVQARLNFKEDPGLKGGLAIALGDVLLDFSLQSRLQNFWS